MNATALRRFAAHMYPLLATRQQPTITARPQPGNELILTLDAAGAYRLTLRREELPIDADDAAAVAAAFVVPENVDAAYEQRTERQPVSGRDVSIYYARWGWIETRWR